MYRKKVWSIFLPLLFIVNVAVIIILITGTATNTEPDTGNIKQFKYKPVTIPDSVLFAGESVPVDRFDVRESLDRELLVNSYFHSQTLRLIKLAPRYFPVIEPILKEKGIPDDFKYLAVAESGLDPRAVSPAGAVGFWQFLRGTAGEFGLEVNREVDERYHIEKSTYAACDYLLNAYEKYGKWSVVAAAYNAGMNGVTRQMERQKSDSYYDLLFGQETSRYVFRLIALKLILEDPHKYNFDVPEEEKYPVIATKDIEINGPVVNFADFAAEQGINYKLLKDFNPWLRDNFLTNSQRKRYIVKIPVLN
ncbi:MAG: lytic transglycosylase domain-containing protein [Prolixibacteraceae bacterium]|nr:lytic transglycosylase domain-containing protein [Prolixibacteraceae bacterium]